MASFYIDYENVHNGGTNGIELLSSKEYVFMFFSHNANTMHIETVKHFLNSKCGIEFMEVDSGTPNALDFQLVTFLYSGIEQDDYHYIISKDHGFDAAIKMGKRMGINNVSRFNTIEDAYAHYEKYKSDLMENTEPLEAVPEKNVEELQEEQIQKVRIQDGQIHEVQIQEGASGIETIINSAVDNNRTVVKEYIEEIINGKCTYIFPKNDIELICDGIWECDSKLNLYHYFRKKLGDKRGKSVYALLSEEFMQIKMDLAM